ncbi:hypothetical protein [Lacticaseibacillus sharpeae]|nr:hypothetical protein [Lacticaseibacillus sharpeae]
MIFTEELHNFDPSDPIDRTVIEYGKGLTVGLTVEQIHQLRISLATDLYASLTEEGHKALLDLVCAIDYLYRDKLKELSD